MNKMETLICPHTENCPIYANWVAGSNNDKRINVISKMAENYSCLAMSAYHDPQTEGGVADSKHIEGRIAGSGRGLDCSHITLLNSLSQIIQKQGVESLL